MFVEVSDFDGALSLPVLGNEEAIEAAIELYHDEYLRQVMGDSLFLVFSAEIDITSAFSDGFDDGFGNGDSIPDRWRWVLYGHTYTHGGHTHIWEGIQKAIADYIYWQYRAYTITYTMAAGEASGKSENADMVRADLKMIRAWNHMVRLSNGLAHMLYYLRDVDDTTISIYPEFDDSQPCRNVYRSQNSFGI